jgi:hypothetical protein
MKNNSKLGGFNFILISVISVLYILMVNKLAELISLSYDEPETQISTYVTIIYFISIMGMVIGYIYLNDEKSNHKSANWITKWSLNIGGIILLIYTITNYWEYLGDYSKLILISLSIISIIYYLYKNYD